MIKNRFKKVALAILLSTTSLMAGESLVGVEGGYTSMNTDIDTPTTTRNYNNGLFHGGVKIGAESGDYRVFLSARSYYDDQIDFDYITAYGVEIQYIFNIASSFNLFVGANAGTINMKFKIDGENFSRTISDSYYGGDIGINMHVRKNVDFEIGTKLMILDVSNTKDDVTYQFNNMTTAYASIIFKYQMD